MLFIIPFLFALAGTITLLFTKRIRPYIPPLLNSKSRSKTKDSDRVVVKGHTYSEAVEQDEKPAAENENEAQATIPQSRCAVENIRRCCIIGVGREGAITGIVLAARNPDVQFCVVDTDAQLIQRWNSDSLPSEERGLEEMVFDDEILGVRVVDEDRVLEGGKDGEGSLSIKTSVSHVERRRKMLNLSFSTDIHAAVVAADLVFLCVEMDSGAFDSSSPHAYLNQTLQTIALASKGHKIIVQRTTAPYGATAYIKDQLQELSSPKATYTVLSNPSLTLHSNFPSTLHPATVIIGHIYSPSTSAGSITALKRLYSSWIPEERIVTMDAYSAELGALAAKALVVQQVLALRSIRTLCKAVKASSGNVGWMLGCPDLKLVGIDGDMESEGMEREVKCIMGLARQLGLEDVRFY
ncbi:hypothetical protein BDW74DRAFT_184192 [Aspergillus multicolor]|uniref:uncharacterized protein n=1 Tax=Aspergillus multicolor TaxID=41759 RepID=UPI003CCD69D1